jgi:hypothetical protein
MAAIFRGATKRPQTIWVELAKPADNLLKLLRLIT